MQEKKLMADSYFELTPDGSLFLVPIVRSMFEVLRERELVAKYFEGGHELRILSGICDLIKAQIMLESRGLIYNDSHVSLSLQMQNKIDVYNHVTAEQVIKNYEASSSNG